MFNLNPRIFIPAALAMLFIIIFATLAKAQEVTKQEINLDALANAIYKAENSKAHPYGILTHYKHTTPRQACINTIKHALRDWNGNGDFIAFLGARYCPIGASNDPRNLNKNWVKNVRNLYQKEVIKLEKQS